MKPSIPALLCLALLSSVQQRTRAATVNLRPAADSYLRNTLADGHGGSATALLAGVSEFGSATNRVLLQFDLTGISTNATVNAATLRLIVTKAARPATHYDLSRLLQPWTESDVTWNRRTAAAAWTVPGAQHSTDFAPAPSATTVLGGTGATNAFTSAQLAADVQLWINTPGTNFGWILLATGETAGTGRQIGSREDPGSEPLLSVDLTLAGAPAPPTLTAPVLETGEFRFGFNAEAGRSYTVEFRDFATTNDWATLTNLAAQPAATTLQLTNTVESGQRCFRVSTP